MNEAGDDARDKPATAIEDDLSENENDSNLGDDSSSTEDDVILPTVSDVAKQSVMRIEMLPKLNQHGFCKSRIENCVHVILKPKTIRPSKYSTFDIH